jgi:hypothetical protein
MPAEIRKEIQLEIAHVLFIDIVGYSKLSIDEQTEYLEQLREIVRATESFRVAPPGGITTFHFSVQPVDGVAFDMFQLLAEGRCWIPNTRFRVSPWDN